MTPTHFKESTVAQASRPSEQHNIFCPTREWFDDPFRDYWIDPPELECTCELINKVRADEQQRTDAAGTYASETTGPAKARVMIENLRTIAGLNIVDIAELMRVSRQTVHNWINGDTVTAENRERLAMAYRVVTEAVVGMSADDARAYLHADSEGGKTRLATIGSRLDFDQIDSRGPNAYDLLVGDADVATFSVEKFGRRVDVGPIKPFVSKGPKTV